MLTSLNENHARVSTLESAIQTIKLLVSANIGSSGFGDWGNGSWIKYLEFWDAFRSFDVSPDSVSLPYKVGNGIAKIYDTTNHSNVVSTNVYMVNTRVLTIPSGLVGKPIYIEINAIKNVRD